MSADLQRQVLEMVAGTAADPRDIVERLLGELEAGTVRAAEPDGDGWKVNAWVKEGILHAFRIGRNAPMGSGGLFISGIGTRSPPGTRTASTGTSGSCREGPPSAAAPTWPTAWW